MKPSDDSIRVEGQRIILRPVTPDDAEAVFSYASDSEVTHFLPWEPAQDSGTVRAFLEEQERRRQRGESLALAIIERQACSMVGSVDLMGIGRTTMGIYRRNRSVEIGYLLARPFWGQGFMTEAAALAIAYGFQNLKIERIFAWADSENYASRRVLEKVGMAVHGSESRLVKGRTRLYLRYDIDSTSTAAEQE